MIIGYDLQALQTKNSRNRGIGIYCKNLLNEILSIDSEDNFKLFLNNNYNEKINLKVNEKSEFVEINYSSQNEPNIVVNNLTQFLKYESKNLDILHILSPFEGYPSNLPVINPYFERLNSIVCVTIHDFIPTHFPEKYFPNEESKKAYYKQLRTVYHADLLFVHSEFNRRDAINLLGINPNKVVNIKGSISDSFFPLEKKSNKKLDQLKKKFNIKSRFILYTGGIDFRKNIEKAIVAFSKIESSYLEEVSFVIVCSIENIDRKRLSKFSKSHGVEENVIFTGFVEDELLNLLYNSCDFFIFPSLMEGFGIPLLEAMKCGAPVIGSKSSSIQELIEDEDFMFDPQNEKEITSLINKMLSDPKLLEKSKKHSIEKSSQYSWNKVANKVISCYKELHQNKTSIKPEVNVKKPKIAYFSPLPPAKSGISDYNSTLLPFLSKYWDIDLFIDDYDCNDPFLTSNFEIYSYSQFEKVQEFRNYDSIVYHFGNSANHIYMFDLLKKHPGIVILHDIYLGGVIYWMTGKVGKIDDFIDNVVYSHGEEGKKLVKKAQQNLIPWEKIIWDLQINKKVLDQATHVIVHSTWDKENILKLYPENDKKISVIPLLSQIKEIDKTEDKTLLGFNPDDFLICTFGFVVPTKKIDDILKNIQNFLVKNKKTKFVVVGDIEDRYAETIKKLVQKLDLSEKVVFTDYLDSYTYKKYLNICDVCIQFRKDFRGGGSLTVNQSLGAGIPTIISSEGPFKEYPDDVVIKIGTNEEKNLGEILQNLYEDPEKRKNLGINSKNYTIKNLLPDNSAQKYVNVVNKMIKNKQ